MKNDIQAKLKATLVDIATLTDDTIARNLHLLSKNYRGEYVIDICGNHDIATEFIQTIESKVFDTEDTEYYNWLLGRKPISYNFHPSNRKRAEAILAIITTI